VSCKPPRGGGEASSADRLRLALFRRAGEALESFFSRWTAAFCAHCLEVTRRHHASDPRADVDLVSGVFPGCCQAGVADALWVPGWGDRGRFSSGLAAAMARARDDVTRWAPAPEYVVRERTTGIAATGVGCGYLGSEGCGLGWRKSPLCHLYACESILHALAGLARPGSLGEGTDDFAAGREALGLVVCGGLREAEAAVAALEERLTDLERSLEAEGLADGEDLYRRWAAGASPTACAVAGGG